MWTELIIFNIAVIALLVLDLNVFHKKPHEVRIKEACYWTLFWIALSLLFCLGIYLWQGKEQALTFLTAYLVEKSLSIDNIFVFIVIFSFFKVPESLKHKILFWGILGALISRALFIIAGISLIQHFHFILYLLAIFIILAGIKILFKKDKEVHIEKNPVLKFIRRYIPITNEYVGDKFFIKENAKWLATPLFIVLIMIESTDVIFALDSIPAVLAITLDPFLAYTSNILAILGLRALYFALAHILPLFHYLHYGIGLILSFVGIKMLLSNFYPIPTLTSLFVITTILGLSVTASLLFKK
ncbi:MAG: TerC family protein [Chlamydiales bacterium]|nr:TerC family protein [Chlamydiales bacterium]